MVFVDEVENEIVRPPAATIPWERLRWRWMRSGPRDSRRWGRPAPFAGRSRVRKAAA